jgi:hypothetical protein
MEIPYTPTLRSQLDVEEFWRTLMRPLGWHYASLWFVVVDLGGRPIPVMNEIEEVPDLSSRDVAGYVAERLGHVLGGFPPGCRLALLYSRPGRGRPTEHDRAAMRELRDALRAHDVRCEVLHIATDTGIYPMTGDDVLAA